MAPRASWKGQLKLSLVTFPVRLFNATSSSSRITLNQLHKDCFQRLRQQMVCPEHGTVDRTEIVKGYEYEKGKYVVIDDADLEKVRLETTKTIELVQFVGADEVDPLYFDTPYYMAPDGPVAEQAFRVIREAMREENLVGIGRVVISNREHVGAMQVKDRGFQFTMLRYAQEVRSTAGYFDEIRNGDVNPAEVQLATQLIEHLKKPFDPTLFTDRYQDGLLDIIKLKIAGTEPVLVQEQEIGKVINLMDALKASLPPEVQAAQAAGTPVKKPPAKSIKRTKPAAERKARAKGA